MDRRIKVINEDNKEVPFDWHGGTKEGKVYDNYRQVFLTQSCYNCQKYFTTHDVDFENYELWTGRTISFLNNDYYGSYTENVGLEAVFYITKLTHKNCPEEE